MATGKTIRLSKLAREFNVGIHTIVEFLHKKGFDFESNPNTKISEEAVALLEKEYKIDLNLKKESEKIILKSHRPKQEVISIEDKTVDRYDEEEEEEEEEEERPRVVLKKTAGTELKKKEQEEPPEEKLLKESKIKVVGKIDLDRPKKPVLKEKEETEKEPEQQKQTAVEPSVPTPAKEKKEAAEEPAEVEEKKKKEEEEKTDEIVETDVPRMEELKVVGKIDLDALNQKTRPAKKSRKEREKERKERRIKKAAGRTEEKVEKEIVEEAPVDSIREDEEVIKARAEKLTGPTVLGKIELPDKKTTKKQKDTIESLTHKKRRKRIKETGRIKVEDKVGEKTKGEPKGQKSIGRKKKVLLKKEVDEEEVQKQIKDTLARLTSKGKSKGSKHRREKRAAFSERRQADMEKNVRQQKILKATEFVSVNELANMMNVNVNEIISRLKEGRFSTQIEVKGFEPLIDHLDLASNRVAIAIVLAALIIGASILTQWEQLRWIGAAVFILAGLLGFWLLIKLFKRGRY